MQRTDFLSSALDATIPGHTPPAAHLHRRFPTLPRTDGIACPGTEERTERRSLTVTIAQYLARVARDRSLGEEAFPLLWW